MKIEWKKAAITSLVAASMIAGTVIPAMADAAPDGKTDAASYSETTGTQKEWKEWQNSWKKNSTDWTKISLAPGSDQSKLNFAWYTKSASSLKNADGRIKLQIGTKKSMKGAKTYTAKQTEVADEKDAEGNTYVANKVTAKGLKEGQKYYYRYEKEDGKYTSPASYTVQSSKSFKFIFVGDPQIGSSNSEKGKDSEAFYTAQSASVCSDSFNWAHTLKEAEKKTGGKAAFVMSAGDQIQTTKKKAPNKEASKVEIEYAGYLAPATLKSLPVATTVGNHDADNPAYTYHFNRANVSSLGSNGTAGGDYAFTYGKVLFIDLNTQDTNAAEHKEFIKKTVAAHKDCKWRIVTLHQDIYGSAEHSNEPEITNLRYTLVPYFEEYGIDVVLTGHDHAYSRSKILKGGKSKVSYDDDAFDKMLSKDIDAGDDPAQRTVAPQNIKDDTTDKEEQEYLNYLKSIMDDDAVQNVVKKNNTAVNPDGILYMTADSASGSKYYDLVSRKQSYIANRWQEDVPTYTVVSVSGSSLTLKTYRADNGKKIDSSFTITKTSTAKLTKAQLRRKVKAAK
ncbi:MAG: metallophosphoesterase, partial [Anaerovoracaceae bacterium]